MLTLANGLAMVQVGMARKLRVQYPGAIYHVINRGDRREPIFADDTDRRLFLDTLAETCGKTDWEVHVWCLSQRIAAEELEALGWGVQDLRGRRKSDPQKERIAVRLPRETTMTLARIAERLSMGAPTHLASLLQHLNQRPSISEGTLF